MGKMEIFWFGFTAGYVIGALVGRWLWIKIDAYEPRKDKDA